MKERSVHLGSKLNDQKYVRMNDVKRPWLRLGSIRQRLSLLKLKSVPVLKMELGAPSRIRLDLLRRQFEHHVGDHVGVVVVSLVAVQLMVHEDLEVSTES